MLNYLGIFVLFGFISSITCQNVSYRLPANARPLHYDLTIETFMDTFTFTGIITITFQVLQTTNRIVLHARDLSINHLTISTALVHNRTIDSTTDFLIINLDRNLLANSTHTLYAEYNATLGTGNVGYYRAAYVNELSQTRYLAVTHLEATNARRAFPCFDQPNYKATFQINLVRSNAHVTASNMRRTNSVTLAVNRIRDEYEITVPMSTYLIAFMVSDYENIEAVVNHVTYRTFGRSELIRRGEGNYSLEVGPQAIQAMESFTNVSYALWTMDQVPVPNEFYKIGAMENWGMVTYRERYLMFNNQTTTASEQQFITTIITHEFAHQWFGNLVTPEWWKYIWLNEGFATYFEMFATSQFEPTWRLMDQFITSVMQPAFNYDQLETSRPMTREAESPAEIDAQYDTIVYEKAGSVIRMVANFLGETVFRNGLTQYLNTWGFRNVNPSILYSYWQTALGSTAMNVSNILAGWETQSGYPVVTVTRLANGTTVLNQLRFLLNRETSSDDGLWQIPLNWFTINSTTSAITWLTTQNYVINLSNISPQQWVIFNINRAGFYRVNYDSTNWRLIRDYLRTGNYTAIPVTNRAQLVDDSFNLARSLRLSYSVALDIGSYIQNETEYVPIVTFTSAFSHLDRLATGLSHYETIKNYGRNILEGYFNRTQFIQQNDDHLTKLTKVTVLTWLCNLEHAGCRNNSRDVFANWTTQSTAIQPDSQSFVFCNGIRESNVAAWNLTLSRYVSLRDYNQRLRIAQGLGCSTDLTVLSRLLNMVIASDSVFSASHKLPIVTSVYTNNGAAGVNLVLEWIIPNYGSINYWIGSISSIITGVTSRITTNEQLQLFNNFTIIHGPSFTSSENATIRAALETAQLNLQWINSTSSDFEDYFNGSGMIYSQLLVLFTCMFILLFYK